MLLIFLLIYGIILLCRLPGILRKPITDFPSGTPAMFEEWRRTEVRIAVVVMLCGWGFLALCFVLGFVLALARVITAATVEQSTNAINIVGLVIVLVGVFWASGLQRRAKLLKDQMSAASSVQAGSYYPRPGTPAGSEHFMPPPLQVPDAGIQEPPVQNSPQT